MIVYVENSEYIENIRTNGVQHWWLTPVILTTWEAEIGRIVVPDQPRQIVHKTSSLK
jgi:hypothetical protein